MKYPSARSNRALGADNHAKRVLRGPRAELAMLRLLVFLLVFEGLEIALQIRDLLVTQRQLALVYRLLRSRCRQLSSPRLPRQLLRVVLGLQLQSQGRPRRIQPLLASSDPDTPLLPPG